MLAVQCGCGVMSVGVAAGGAMSRQVESTRVQCALMPLPTAAV